MRLVQLLSRTGIRYLDLPQRVPEFYLPDCRPVTYTSYTPDASLVPVSTRLRYPIRTFRRLDNHPYEEIA